MIFLAIPHDSGSYHDDTLLDKTPGGARKQYLKDLTTTTIRAIGENFKNTMRDLKIASLYEVSLLKWRRFTVR